jgi:two-component system nitrate/nitrite sensor histidine kinase NarX
MANQLQTMYARLEQRVTDRTRELASLNAISATVSQSLDLDEILDQALEETLEVIGIEAGGIYLLDDEEQVLHVAACRGFGPEFVTAIDHLSAGEGFSGEVIQSGKPLVVGNVSVDPRLTRMAVRDEGLSSLVVVPLTAKAQVLGTLFVLTAEHREFAEQDVQLLASIGNQIGVAVENARFYEQAQQLAVLEERQRLARELHDAVTQTLFSASLLSEALPSIWQEDQKEGAEVLEELHRLSRGALAEMRTLLLELRPAVLSEANLGDLLRQLGEAITGRTGAPVAVQIGDYGPLPPDVHVAFYRIAQEALNNVVKHAQASVVSLVLSSTSSTDGGQPGREVRLQVSDDGRGFDSDSVTAERLGLGIMSERARAIGATLHVESEPGGGTVVTVVWVDSPGSHVGEA